MVAPDARKAPKMDYETKVYGGPSYDYMKNKARFFGEEGTGMPGSS